MISSTALTTRYCNDPNHCSQCPGLAAMPGLADQLGVVTKNLTRPQQDAFQSTGLHAANDETPGTIPVQVLTDFVTNAIRLAVEQASQNPETAGSRLNLIH